MSEEQKASVGRIVHYVSRQTDDGVAGVCQAAIVTRVQPDGTTVGLAILAPTLLTFAHGVKYEPVTEGPPVHRKPGTWHWPERV